MFDPDRKPSTNALKNRESFDVRQGLRSQHFTELMEKFPGLREKLYEVKKGKIPDLNQDEKEFFVDLIANNEEGISSVVIEVAGKVWNAQNIEWEQNNRPKFMNIEAALWGHFDKSLEGSFKLVDFFLGTTKAEAEAEIIHWEDWKGRTDIALIGKNILH